MKKFDSLLTWASWIYTLTTILALAIMYLTGDQWWPGTMLLFGPRWILALPLILLLPLALWRRPRLLVPHLIAMGIVFGPFMGLRWTFSKPQAEENQVIRVLTCNIGEKFDAHKLTKLIVDHDIDIVSLQEVPGELKLDLPGWHSVNHGGLAVFSRYPIEPVKMIKEMHLPHYWPRYSLISCRVSRPQGEFLFHAVHLPSPRFEMAMAVPSKIRKYFLDEKTEAKLQLLGILTGGKSNRESVSQKIAATIEGQSQPFVIAGDFNMPVESVIYRTHWSKFKNALSTTTQGYGWTFRDVVHEIPFDVRIDHVLTGADVRPISSVIEPDIGSNHRPVISSIAIKK